MRSKSTLFAAHWKGFLKLLVSISYSCLLSYLVFFARRRRHISERLINEIPLKNTFKDFVKLNLNSDKELYHFYTNLIGNIIIFIPVPAIFILFKIESSRTILFLSFLLSLFIECIQYVFRIGVADVDDIILNVMGSALGLLLICHSGIGNCTIANSDS
ncbi:VanZ family protein [Hymenobacter arizonensis]|uniref:VanZ family protein n=1 Tax=Hymenobacter arizonensis TaxID=1227077 RepID=UPI000ABE2A13